MAEPTREELERIRMETIAGQRKEEREKVVFELWDTSRTLDYLAGRIDEGRLEIEEARTVLSDADESLVKVKEWLKEQVDDEG